MIHTYAAVFSDDEESKNCHVSFPNFSYETDIAYSDKADLLRKASEELGFAMWMCEEAGRKMPKPNTISERGLREGESIKFIDCDYDRIKQSISVTSFNLA